MRHPRLTQKSRGPGTEADTRAGLHAACGGPGSDVLTCGNYDNRIRWRPGERLEELFEQRCDELAGRGAIAVDGPNGRLSYAELDARASQLARFLGLRQGVKAGDRIGLLFDRPVDGYVALLAVLKLHAAYVPLDPGFPADRLAFIASDARARMVLSQSHLQEQLAGLGGAAAAVYLDEWEVEIAGERDDRLGSDEVSGPVDDLCYVIYTSGTTGRPKGVAVGHPSICNFVRVAAEVYGIRPDDRVYQGLTLAFDFSIEEIWVAWMVGATLVPKPQGGALLGSDLHDFLAEHRVSALCCVPTLLGTLGQDLPHLRFLLVSGEACPQDLVDRWYRPGRRFLNVYGPTEATVSASWTELHPSRPVTIGVPLPTYTAVVLDPEVDRALPRGALGELGIAGIGLADGYLGRPELTQRAFIPDFLSLPDNPSGRIYRTGDLVRVGADGEIEHHGRIDTQVKVRGYRIEVGEIEAVLRKMPGIAQAVVDVCELEPGVKDLAAYYTVRTGEADPDPACIYSALREKLPSYMVPAFLERLEEVPMLPSGKADRGSLPKPRGPRQCAAADEYVGPASPIEAVLADELASILGLEHVSVESHFFDTLGANSLLMARYAARLRDAAGELPPVSMKDIYVHPTVRRLAVALERADSAGQTDAPPRWVAPELPPAIGTPHYVLCGVLQLLAFVACVGAVGVGLDAGASWLFAAHGALDTYLRAVVLGAGLLFGTGLLPIAAKWILIGRWKPQSIRVWSLAYFRFWVVKTLIVLNPLPHLLVDTPLYALYLRALGAKIGRRVLIFSQHIPVCADLLSIGDDTVIHKDAFLNGYRARAGMIEIGPVRLGENVFVGERTVLDIYATLRDGASLGHSSSLQAGQVVPAGECWHGSPGQPAPADYDYRTVASLSRSRPRGVRYSAGRLLLLTAVAGPLEAALSSLLLTHPSLLERLPVWAAPTLAAGVLFGTILVLLSLAVGVPRLLRPVLEPGTVYPVYSFQFSVQRLVARASNNHLLTHLFGDSCLIVHYLRALGYRFGVVEQTGTNFGTDVKQEVPALSHIGTGTMVSDGLSMMNAEFSSTSFRVMPVVVGKRNYCGNDISYPAAARTGDNVLFGTKAMVPIGGPIRSDVGLLGSPCFEIPRSVQRDRQFEAISTGAERARRLRAKTRHNVVSMGLHLLVDYLLVLGVVLIAELPLGGTGVSGVLGTVAATVVDVAFMLALFVVAERAVTGFRSLQPRYCSVLQPEFWRHERFWKVVPTGYVHMFDGTPFKSLMWRALGVPVGRRVFDDGLAITERTLVSIGDECTFNMGCHLQSHTLEDGAFKSDMIVVGNRVTVGTGALVNYGVLMGDGSVLDPDSFLMKGSRTEPGAHWRGNPATEVPRQTRADDAIATTLAEIAVLPGVAEPHPAGPEAESELEAA